MEALATGLFGVGCLLLGAGVWWLFKPLKRLPIGGRALGVVAICLSLFACVQAVELGPAPTAGSVASLPPKIPQIDGFIVEGGPEEAKASGLSYCKDASDGYSCLKAYKVTFLGFPARRASAWIHYPGTLQLPAEKRTPADLRYDEISIEFEPVDWDYPCDEDTLVDPNACASDPNASLVQLERRLASEGWRYFNYRWGREYVKAGEPVKITVGQGRSDGVVTLRRVSDEERADQLQRIQAETESIAKAKREREAFIRKMAE